MKVCPVHSMGVTQSTRDELQQNLQIALSTLFIIYNFPFELLFIFTDGPKLTMVFFPIERKQMFAYSSVLIMLLTIANTQSVQKVSGI
jgi:hypothetical protein